MRAYIHAFRGNPWNEECQAAKIAIDTAKRFVASRPGRLDGTLEAGDDANGSKSI